jgi:hypothetical protein
MSVRVTKWTIVPDDEPIFSEMATDIEITDDAGGEYLTITQHGEGCGAIKVDPEEWAELRGAIDKAVKECRKEKA